MDDFIQFKWGKKRNNMLTQNEDNRDTILYTLFCQILESFQHLHPLLNLFI